MQQQDGKLAVVVEKQPKAGDKINIFGGDGELSVAEVIEVAEAGKQLIATIKAAC